MSPEGGRRLIGAGVDLGIHQPLTESIQRSKGHAARCRRQLVGEMENHVLPGGQIEYASNMGLAAERRANFVILLRALESALILQAEAPDLAVDPDVHDSVIVFLIRTAGYHVAGGDLDVRLPVGQ